MKEKVTLIILDGWGFREGGEGNAIDEARTKNMDKYIDKYPFALVEASGQGVGLEKGIPGFCENNYQVLGSGKLVKWDHYRFLKRLDKPNKSITDALSGKKVHVFVVLTENGIYSHIELLSKFLKIVRSKRKKNVYVHLILEGRESGLNSAYDLFNKWKDDLLSSYLSSIVGARYALNRNVASQVLLYLKELSSPEEIYPSFISALMTGYDHGENDYTLKPRVIDPNGSISPGDHAVILGYRSSKWEALVSALLDLGVKVFMPTYFDKRVKTFMSPSKPKGSFIEAIAKTHRIVKIGESEKGKDLTYFFTGTMDIGESIIFESPSTLDYSVTPEMRAPEITGEALKAIKSKQYDFIVVSFANPDVIAHTGNYSALINAIEIVDDGVGRIVRAAQKEGMVPIVVGDHGNAEEMFKNGMPYLGHTTNPVPFIIAHDKVCRSLSNGSLPDVTATIAKIMKKRVKLDGKPLF